MNSSQHVTDSESTPTQLEQREPDVMNDSAFDPKPGAQEKADDVDTCRICRGEGSKDEELFYPCKCSGSIKHVHQNCLVEWLSHSQKKHCELCKTPFRFTKLYDAQMPQSVPLPVFLRQAVIHTSKSVLKWARLHLVVFVWVLWLPWCTRAVWRGLFWLGDGGWVDSRRTSLENVVAGTSSAQSTTSASPEALATAIVSQISEKLSRRWDPFTQLIAAYQDGPFTFRLIRKMMRAWSGSQPIHSFSSSAAGPGPPIHASQRPPSLLSNATFFDSLTRSTMLNNIIIDTLEGQMITMLVVVVFIVVFLIREWVMQQQQNLLIERGVNQNDAVEQRVAPRVDADAAAQPEGNGVNNAEQVQGVDGGPLDNGQRLARPAARVFARPRRRLQRRATDPEGQTSAQEGAETSATANIDILDREDPTNRLDRDVRLPHSQLLRRPTIPDKGVMERALELRRTLEEPSHSSTDQGGSEIQVFKDLWNRADQNPQEVLRIIEEENCAKDLEWIVRFMNYLEGSGPRQGAALQRNDMIPSTQSPAEPTLLERLPQETENATAPSQASVSHNLQLDVDGQTSASHTDGHASLDAPFVPNDPLYATSASGSADRSVERRFSEPTGELSPPASPHPGERSPSSYLARDFSPPAPPEASTDDVQLVAQDTVEGNAHVTDVSTEDNAPPTDNRIGTSPIAAPPDQPLYERLMNWLWGEAAVPNEQPDQPAEDEEHVVQNIAEEAPFVPAANRQQPQNPHQNPEQNQQQDPEFVAAAIEAGMDPNPPEGLDDIEDLEGILELVGMQGPILGLVQNGMFCALLVCLAIGAAIWIPYMFGKFFLIGLAHPLYMAQQPLRAASTVADMLVDFCVFAAGCSYYWVDRAISFTCAPIGWLVPSAKGLLQTTILAETARNYAERALKRLALASMDSSEFMATAFDIPKISVLAHESLRLLETRFAELLRWATSTVVKICETTLSVIDNNGVPGVIANGLRGLYHGFQQVAKAVFSLAATSPSLLHLNPLRFSLPTSMRETPLDYSLVAWGTRDKIIAILSGYLFFGLLGALYVRLAAVIWGKNKKGRAEGGLAELLYQAGGVMKVVLIISIEMIVFPLYCGLLLDAALLPLFANTTVRSRISFTMISPNTSLFIHWFIGTCYMFHFALFVSMCRKIMRTGVLFFIRDPDDPTFHPVRDVLERPITTQLWKISFSAVVYGGLVLACLGGVVWGVGSVFNGVFPIHWSSSEPILEFPVDILFYNFLMPLAVKFFKPSTGMTDLYTWWFRKSARWLRLSSFLFGVNNFDEEGRHLRQTWKDWLLGKECGACKAFSDDPTFEALNEKSLMQGHQKDVEFIRNGTHVLAPSSDQIRIPKDYATFHSFSDDGETVRVDDKLLPWYEQNKDSFTKVYMPPFFKLRIAALICLIWLFAAGTGISVTVVPLLFGRVVLSRLIPNYLRMNDVYAFSLGIYVLGGAVYSVLNYHRFKAYIDETFTPHATTVNAAVRKVGTAIVRALKLLYALFAFGIVLPALISLAIQCFLIVPIYTYILIHTKGTEFANENISTIPTPVTISSLRPSSTSESIMLRPMIHLIQDWTLGILYVKVFGRLILWTAPSRPATALRNIIRNGWLNPDIWLATRGFILPSTLLMVVLLGAPLALARLALRTVFASVAEDEISRSLVYRFSYPALMIAVVAIGLVFSLSKAFGRWRRRVRDEVYLIGERLHNYGEARRKQNSNKQKSTAKGKEKEEVQRPTSGEVAAERPGLERRGTA